VEIIYMKASNDWKSSWSIHANSQFCAWMVFQKKWRFNRFGTSLATIRNTQILSSKRPLVYGWIRVTGFLDRTPLRARNQHGSRSKLNWAGRIKDSADRLSRFTAPECGQLGTIKSRGPWTVGTLKRLHN